MDRTAFIKEIVVNDVPQLDHLQNNIIDFQIRYEPVYYRVSEEDVMRPDLISYKHYSTVAYWWIICAVNGIQNPLVDINVNDILTIPTMVDIYEFAKKRKLK